MGARSFSFGGRYLPSDFAGGLRIFRTFCTFRRTDQTATIANGCFALPQQQRTAVRAGLFPHAPSQALPPFLGV